MPPKRKWLRRLFRLFVALFAVLILADFGYSRYVNWAVARFESQVERTDAGVAAGCEAYTIGTGDTAILFIHGINESAYTWRKMAPRFESLGYTCRVMRLPGFAETNEMYGSHTADDWVKVTLEELESLNQKHDRVFVVAHSLGGAVAIQAILQQPAATDGLILLAPAVQVSNTRSPILSTRSWHELGKWLWFTDTLYSPFGVDVNDPAERSDPNRTPFTPMNVVDGTFDLIDRNTDRADEIVQPVLLVVSHSDAVIESDAAVGFFANRELAKTEVFWNDKATHGLPYDFGWEEVVDHAHQFIQSTQLQTDDAAIDSRKQNP
ncbi:MAG: alpha/beta fold hydrolase [Pirellulaceae bacterium]